MCLHLPDAKEEIEDYFLEEGHVLKDYSYDLDRIQGRLEMKEA